MNKTEYGMNKTEATISDQLFTGQEAATYINTSERTVRNLNRRGIIPAIKLSSRLVRYRKSDLDRVFAKLTTGVA
jgi:excisionase family DNA binding protein